MTKKTVIILLILGGLFILYLAYSRYVTYQTSKIQSANIDAQAGLIRAQAEAQEQCKKNWLCATTSVLGGIGGAVTGFFGNNSSTN